MRASGRALPTLIPSLIGWCAVCWVVFVWRRGYPSFWDPDEATYAEATREMLAAHNWLVPMYDGRPFFDKPPLFYIFQMASFSTFGATEFAARVVPAISAIALLVVIGWLGTQLFNREVGRNGALMFAVLPATFALSSYAILDMTFTLFLFGGCAFIAVSALRNRPRLQYVGFVFLAAAVLTKGPLALILAGLALLLVVATTPDARPLFRRLHWVRGFLTVVVLAAPWFVYMWRGFGDAFVNGYVLNENLKLFAGSLYGTQRSILFYPKVILVGMLPWTPLLLGRLVDAWRGLTLTTAERLLWCWSVAVVGFFSVSGFKLDHYIFPAAPALALLSAQAWDEARHREVRPIGIVVGLATIPVVLLVAGVVMVPGLNRVPLALPTAVRLLPVALIASGIAMMAQVARRWRPSTLPFAAVAGLLVSYATVITVGLPAFELAKPTKRLAQLVATAASADDQVAMYRLNRWSSSWRFYVGRHSDRLDTTDQLRAFFATPGRHYCAMLRRDYDQLAGEGFHVRVIHEEAGLFTTTGRSLRSGSSGRHDGFVVVTEDSGT